MGLLVIAVNTGKDGNVIAKCFNIVEAMKQGHKITHRFFTPEEWVRMLPSGLYEMEDGVRIFPNSFWRMRESSEWQDGWEIWTDVEK